MYCCSANGYHTVSSLREAEHEDEEATHSLLFLATLLKPLKTQPRRHTYEVSSSFILEDLMMALMIRFIRPHETRMQQERSYLSTSLPTYCILLKICNMIEGREMCVFSIESSPARPTKADPTSHDYDPVL